MELSCELDEDYGTANSPGVVEDKLPGGKWKKKALDSLKEGLKDLIPISSRMPPPRQFQKMAPLPPRRSMPMKLPRKAC